MKNRNKSLLLLYCLFLLGCNNDIFDCGKTEGFWMIIQNQTVFNSDIDFYDFSTHTVYLKKAQKFFADSDIGDFSVFVGNQEIYKGIIYPIYFSTLPYGPFISPSFSKENQYSLSIGVMFFSDKNNKDPRNDPRIINSLKSQGKYHEGLQIKIIELKFLSDRQVVLDFQLSNNDSFDYLHLDPDKMGFGLFHYYTNGLGFYYNETYQRYEPILSVIKLEPYDRWEKKWMSVIRSGESKRFKIKYDFSDPIPSGKFQAFFYFPGLSSYQVDINDLNQKEGRIWLGGVEARVEYRK